MTSMVHGARASRASSVCVLLAAALLNACGTVSDGATATSTGRPFARRLDGVPNLAEIEPFLFRGAQPDADGVRELEKLGVRTIISLRAREKARDSIASAGMKLVEIPLRADAFGSEAPTDSEVREFFATALDPALQPVFFHCAQGKDRTGTMAALWRIERDGWTPAEAIEEMHAFGYHDYYEDLIAFVRAYRPRGYGP